MRLFINYTYDDNYVEIVPVFGGRLFWCYLPTSVPVCGGEIPVSAGARFILAQSNSLVFTCTCTVRGWLPYKPIFCTVAEHEGHEGPTAGGRGEEEEEVRREKGADEFIPHQVAVLEANNVARWE